MLPASASAVGQSQNARGRQPELRFPRRPFPALDPPLLLLMEEEQIHVHPKEQAIADDDVALRQPAAGDKRPQESRRQLAVRAALDGVTHGASGRWRPASVRTPCPEA